MTTPHLLHISPARWAQALVLAVCASGASGLQPAYNHISLHAAATLLNVRLYSPRNVVRAAYRRRAALAHPDVNQAAGAHADFIRLTEAYKLLLVCAPPQGGPTFNPSSNRASPPPTQQAEHPPEATTVGWEGGFASPDRPPADGERRRERLSDDTDEHWRDFWAWAFRVQHLELELAQQRINCERLTREVARLQQQLEITDAQRKHLADTKAAHAAVEREIGSLSAQRYYAHWRASQLQEMAMQ